MNNLLFVQFQSSKWSAEPIFLESFLAQLADLNVTESIADIEVAARPAAYQVVNGRAVINILGVLLKTVPSWLRFFGIKATGYDEIQSQIGQALADSSISGIHLQVSSPGGIVDGLVDTADAIFAARETKKVTATIEDIGASAAYWLASQAETIEAGRTAEVGSIGVYTVYLDSSKAADDAGFKVVLIKSGEHKGMGVAGVEITDEQIAAVQESIDAIAGQFVDSIARGRGRESAEISKLATGRMWIAAEAKKLGLIDKVITVTSKSSSNKAQSKKGEIKMDQNENKTVDIEAVKAESSATAAKEQTERMKALSEAFPDDPEYAVKAFTEGKSVEKAKADYCDVLREKIKEQNNSQSQIENRQSKGAAPIESGDTDNAAAGGDFIAEARAMAKEEGISVTAAMKKLNRTNPGLHAAFISRSRAERPAAYVKAG